MNRQSLLYPVDNACRESRLLDGFWLFRFDPDGVGVRDEWFRGFRDGISMPVPGSFAEVFTDRASRDYCGDFWYAVPVFVPKAWEGRRVEVRFGAITHRGTVWLNGQLCCEHEGGFLPAIADITALARYGEENLLVVRANNELSEENLPCGTVQVLSSGRKVTRPYFDFFNYSGLQRSVHLVSRPMDAIEDYQVSFELNGPDALVRCHVDAAEGDVSVRLLDADGHEAAAAEGCDAVLTVHDARLWDVGKPYLYTLVITLTRGGELLDRYEARTGIRTVEVRGRQILLNGHPVRLKGFGKHEDSPLHGRGFSASTAVRDYECLKWIGANCYRTSHYPYSEEWYRLADEKGFLIIDEVPAVGMMRSVANFLAAGTRNSTTIFFSSPTVPTLLKAHLRDVEAMIRRDRNHPSVIAWSLFNEPETTTPEAYAYFSEVFRFARPLDPQKRPLTGALEISSSPYKDRCHVLCDFLCLNRYYGWYLFGGDLDGAEKAFREELDAWMKVEPDKPFIFAEFGTDTLDSLHTLPATMWSQEYQQEYLDMYFRVFDSYPAIVGELAWNFADFLASEGIMRVGGNKKGLFTRDRQPKQAAFAVRERWLNT